MEPEQTNSTNPIEATPLPSTACCGGHSRQWIIAGIIAVAAGLLVGGGVYAVMGKRLSAERNTLNIKITELEEKLAGEFKNRFDVLKIHPGDRVAEMTVVKVGPVNSEVLEHRLDYNNALVEFSGQVNIAGRFYSYLDDPPQPGSEQICFKNLEEWSVVKMPLPYGLNTVIFCFTNNEEAVKYFGPFGNSGEAEVVIDEYTFISYPASLTNTAKLVRVISKNGVKVDNTSSTADWKIFDQEKEGVRNDVLSNFRFPKSWYTFNSSGGPFTEINFSDGGNLVNQDLDNQTITNRLYELHKAQENECRLTVGASAEDKKYNITKYNSKTDDNSRGICDIILTTLQKQISVQY